MEPSLRVNLKGIKRTRDAREFILVRPLAVKAKAYDPVIVGLLGFRSPRSEYALPESRVVVCFS